MELIIIAVYCNHTPGHGIKFSMINIQNSKCNYVIIVVDSKYIPYFLPSTLFWLTMIA